MRQNFYEDIDGLIYRTTFIRGWEELMVGRTYYLQESNFPKL